MATALVAELFIAADTGDYENASLLLQQETDLAKMTASLPHWNRHATALHLACRGGHLRLARLLLKAGADVDAKDEEDWTPLIYAVNAGHDDIAVVLLACYNADSKVCDTLYKRTALDVARYRACPCTCAILDPVYVPGTVVPLKRGNARPRAILGSGVHGKGRDLFLGRFRFQNKAKAVSAIEAYRSCDAAQADAPAVDTVTMRDVHIVISSSRAAATSTLLQLGLAGMHQQRCSYIGTEEYLIVVQLPS